MRGWCYGINPQLSCLFERRFRESRRAPENELIGEQMLMFLRHLFDPVDASRPLSVPRLNAHQQSVTANGCFGHDVDLALLPRECVDQESRFVDVPSRSQ